MLVWCTQNTLRWQQFHVAPAMPALQVYHFSGFFFFKACYKKLFIHVESHVSAASLHQSGEYIYTNYILYKSNQQKTLLVHARLFGCFHNPSNSDMDYMPKGSFRMRMYPHWGTSVYRLVPKRLYRVCTEFDSREISQLTQSLTNNGHPSIW